MYGLTLIAVLAVMGGAIAFIGDRLGSKVGKKRLSMFGLRPRHTSIIVTVITGILIAAATLGVLAAASRDVRTALFGMDALKQQLTVLSHEVKDKNQELAVNQQQLQQKEAEYASLSQKLTAINTQLAQARQELDQVTAQRDAAAAALDKARADYAQAQQDLAASQQELDKSRQEIAALEKTKADLDTKVASLTDAKDSLQSDVDRLTQLTNDLKKGLQYVREGVVAFRAGEIIGTAVLPGGQSQADTEKALGAVMYGINSSLVERLGVTSTNNKTPQVLWIGQSDFNQAVADIMRANGGVVVRVAADGNTIYGEPVIGRIELYPNALIYHKGEVVAQQTVDVGAGGEHAEGAVMAFLHQVNGDAVQRGILPDPIQGTVGLIPAGELFGDISQAKRLGGQVQITATALDDVYTAGPLRIKLDIRRAD